LIVEGMAHALELVSSWPSFRPRSAARSQRGLSCR
jgi:hypothetical protein